MPNLLLSAYSCNPSMGSELTVGWNRTLQAARTGRVWTITEGRGHGERIAIELAERGLSDRVTMVYLPHDGVEALMMNLPGLYYLAYSRWQRRAYQLAKRLHGQIGFDLVHHVNMVGFREPGYMSRLGVPFVLGPVGGTQDYPKEFLWRAGLKYGLIESARTFANGLQLRHGRFAKAARSATVLLSATTTASRDIKRSLGLETDVLLETGITNINAARTWAKRDPGPIRVLWVGEAIFRKGVDVLADAYRLLRSEGVSVELTVVGDGPMMDCIPADDPLVFRPGWIPYSTVPEMYRHADVFVFSSLRDTSGNVVLEALADGLPVVYLDHQGVHDMASPGCGIPVAVTSPAQTVRELADAIRAIGSDPVRYDALSAGAIAQAESFQWNRNADAMAEIYARVLNSAPSTRRRPRSRLTAPVPD